jgi:hypothetical protein
VSDREPDQPLWRISWRPVMLVGDACDRMAHNRLQLVLRRIIRLESTRLATRTPAGLQAIARPVPQVGSRSARWCEVDMR